MFPQRIGSPTCRRLVGFFFADLGVGLSLCLTNETTHNPVGAATTLPTMHLPPFSTQFLCATPTLACCSYGRLGWWRNGTWYTVLQSMARASSTCTPTWQGSFRSASSLLGLRWSEEVRLWHSGASVPPGWGFFGGGCVGVDQIPLFF